MPDITKNIGQYMGLAFGAAAIVIVGVILIKVILIILRKTLKKTTLDESMHKFIVNVAKTMLWIILAVVLLGYMKVPTAPLVAALGAAGAAIALALKDGLGNIAGGILILANKPFKKGDEIDVAGINGQVESIDLFVTTIKTFDNKVVTVPNGTITTSVIVNYSQEEIRRVDFKIGIHYDSDMAQAKDVLLAVAENCPDVLLDPPPVVGVSNYDEGRINLTLKVWCETAVYYDVKYYLAEQVKLAFDEANITIPHPQMDVRVIK
ncbi:MAG: mechanosensitive ion channel family protein [Firmicutes bacterium]|nr:mechanosensitive ion channel family protein [Bacillota bacterium]